MKQNIYRTLRDYRLNPNMDRWKNLYLPRTTDVPFFPPHFMRFFKRILTASMTIGKGRYSDISKDQIPGLTVIL